MLRLDAIAFLWKELGTNSIHLPETHEVVKLLRDIVDEVAPQTILLTETNVPHTENISYFGTGDEAHMVYQFSLPPLLLHGLLNADTTYLQQWAQSLNELPNNCTYLNFTASHDGVGVRPLQGLIPEKELDSLVKTVYDRGGRVSMKKNSDGTESPYELNITYFDALSTGKNLDVDVQRFLCSQAVCLVLQGIPAVYIQSLFACPNWEEGFSETQRARTLNRRIWEIEELESLIADQSIPQGRVFKELNHLLRVRRQIHLFHPFVNQRIHPTDSKLFVVERFTEDDQSILCVFNFSEDMVSIDLNSIIPENSQKSRTDILSGRQFSHDSSKILLGGFEFLWLKN